MEKKFIGETKDWEEVYKTAKELLQEKKIDSVEFVSKKSWEAHLEKIYIFSRIVNEKQLKELFDTEKPYYLNVKEFNLYIMNTFLPLGINNILIVLYYK